MKDTVVDVDRIGKRYRLGSQRKSNTLVGQLAYWATYPVRNFREIQDRRKFDPDKEDKTVLWALKDVSFQVERGEVLGVIGHNGAGKSTLLKILSRITPPTTGTAAIEGRVSSLLEVGTGFHQELTGRDNVFMNGTILGLKHREIKQRFDEIVDFSGIGRHIDTPVKFYSSGMKVRLAFSVAAHLEPEVLIIDEVLAVGDLAFQQKCIGKMDKVAESGRTILFVSHNMGAVEGLCGRCLLMESGQIAYRGSVEEAVSRYRQASLRQAQGGNLRQRSDRDGNGRVRFTSIRFNQGGEVLTGEPLTLEIALEATEDIPNLQIAIKFSRNYREVMMTLDNRIQGRHLSVARGLNTVTVELPRVDLLPSQYLIDLWAGSSTIAEDRIFNAATLLVGERDVYESGLMPRAGKHGYFIPPACDWQSEELASQPSLP